MQCSYSGSDDRAIAQGYCTVMSNCRRFKVGLALHRHERDLLSPHRRRADRNKSKVSGPKYNVAMPQSRARTLSPSQESAEFRLLCSVAWVHPEYSQIA